MNRREYSHFVHFNGLFILKVIIDGHYELSHKDMSDELILCLISELNGVELQPEIIKDEFEYFKVEPLYYDKKPYRLIFLLNRNENFLGVINAFRVRERR